MDTVSFEEVRRFENICYRKRVFQCVKSSNNTVSDLSDAQICKARVPSSSTILLSAHSL
jgi:hypothetical protein